MALLSVQVKCTGYAYLQPSLLYLFVILHKKCFYMWSVTSDQFLATGNWVFILAEFIVIMNQHCYKKGFYIWQLNLGVKIWKWLSIFFHLYLYLYPHPICIFVSVSDFSVPKWKYSNPFFCVFSIWFHIYIRQYPQHSYSNKNGHIWNY